MLLVYIFTWTLCVLLVDANEDSSKKVIPSSILHNPRPRPFGHPKNVHPNPTTTLHHNATASVYNTTCTNHVSSWPQNTANVTWHSNITSTSPTASLNPSYRSLHYSFPSPQVIESTNISQGVLVTSLIPIYEVCNLPGATSTISCSTSIETIIATICNTTLTGWFQTVTITDCSQQVTFSSRNSYNLITTTISPPPTLQRRVVPTPSASTYVETVVSYYIAAWQSIVAHDPTGIQVLICSTGIMGFQICKEIVEVWVVHTIYVPVYLTRIVTLSTSFTSSVILFLGPSQSLTIPAGNFSLSTEIIYTSTSIEKSTSTSIAESSSPLSSSNSPGSSSSSAAPSIWTQWDTLAQTVTVNVELNSNWTTSSPATTSQGISSRAAVTEAVSTQAALSQVASSQAAASDGKELTTTFTTTVQITETLLIPNTIYRTIS